MSFPLIPPTSQFFDSSGSPLVNGTIEFRDPTTNDLVDSYPTADDADAQTNANANPLTLDARGEAAVFLEDGVSYKVILKDELGATVWTRDDVQCPTDIADVVADLASTANGKGASTVGVEDSAGNLTATNVEAALAEIFTSLADPAKVLLYGVTPQELTGAGAVDVTSAITHLVTTGADALTLADGAEGQRKFIVMKTDGGAGTLTPTNLSNGTTITFDDVGDSADLLFTNAAWHFMGGTATLA